MHIHLPDESANRHLMPLYVVNGVTTVLNLDGRPEHLRLRREIESGALLGPRIYSSGPTQRDASLSPQFCGGPPQPGNLQSTMIPTRCRL